MTQPRKRHYLTTYSPSPTTISYTVSTRAPNAATRVKLFTITKHIIRVLLLTSVSIINLTKFRPYFQRRWSKIHPSPPISEYLPGFLASSVNQIAEANAWTSIALVSILITLICLRRDYAEENLLTLSNLGLQTTSTSPWFLPSATKYSTNFIPTTQIQDIVIHEAFQGLEVKFYLAIVVKGRGEVVVVFPVSPNFTPSCGVSSPH